MAEHQLPKLNTWVRFPSPAPRESTHRQRERSMTIKHLAGLALFAIAAAAVAADFKVLQPLADKPMKQKDGSYYVPTTPETARWGSLPNASAKPVLTFDTVSHEGVLEDQGKDPVKFFGQHGVKPDQVLKDAQAIAASNLPHDFVKDGPHVVTGPVAIEGAKACDVLLVEMLALQPRVPYGVISNRHGKGALPGEFPENKGPQAGADAAHPELFANHFTFVPIREVGGKWYAIVKGAQGPEARIALRPFNGTMGVAPNTQDKPNSVPPGEYGGNLDINDLGVGAKL